jgi:hypothetical protein
VKHKWKLLHHEKKPTLLDFRHYLCSVPQGRITLVASQPEKWRDEGLRGLLAAGGGSIG